MDESEGDSGVEAWDAAGGVERGEGLEEGGSVAVLVVDDGALRCVGYESVRLGGCCTWKSQTSFNFYALNLRRSRSQCSYVTNNTWLKPKQSRNAYSVRQRHQRAIHIIIGKCRTIRQQRAFRIAENDSRATSKKAPEPLPQLLQESLPPSPFAKPVEIFLFLSLLLSSLCV